MTKILLPLMLSCLNVSTFKDASTFIYTENDLKNGTYSNAYTISKTIRNDDFCNEVEPVEPEIPADEPNGSSGLDNSKYLELDELENGGYDLPSDADYTDDIGQKLLRYIKPGDIMYDSVGLGASGAGSGHIAFIEGIAYSQRYQKNYIVTIEANPNHGVKRGYIDSVRFKDHKTILRVKNATQAIISDAIYFCRQQLNKGYALNIITKHASINSSEWYCSELVWAAYKYNEQGIDLANGSLLAVSPNHIYDDSDTCKIIKYNTNTTFITNSANHTFYCDGDTFTEPHNHDGDYYSIEQCTICNHVFWPNC